MSLDKKALKFVAIFWALFGCLVGYISLVVYLATEYSPNYMLVGMGIPVALVTSYGVYLSAAAENAAAECRKKELGNL